MSVSHAVEVRSSDVDGQVVAGVPAGASAVRELVFMLEKVADPRDPRGVRHRLSTILMVAVFAVLCGAKNYREVGDRVADLPQPLLALAGARVCAAVLDQAVPTGVKYTKKDVDALPITCHDFHPDWNYTVQPRDTP